MDEKLYIRQPKLKTQAERDRAYNKRKLRTKIANLVARNSGIDRRCCICGQPGKILHNEGNPYMITFICDNCRLDENLVKQAESNRYDIRTKLNKRHKAYSHFTDTEIKQIVDNYLKKMLTIGEYCDEVKLSRHQFNKLVSIYNEKEPKANISQRVTVHSQKIKAQLRNNQMEQNKLWS